MVDFYILWGAQPQSLTQVVSKLFDGQKIIHIEGENFQAAKLGDLTDVDSVVWTACGDVRATLETLCELLEERNLKLARIIGVLDVAAYAGDRKLGDWVKMLSHFSDVMVLDNANDTPPAFISQLERRWKDRPMLIKRWPQAAKDASEILLPEARRLSEFFDAWDEDDEIEFYEDEGGDDDQPWEYEDKKSPRVHRLNVEDVHEPKAAEPYFEKDADGGYKLKVQLP